MSSDIRDQQGMSGDSHPYRAAWDNFPDVITAAVESAVKRHPDYEQAKQANVQDAAPAAKRLSAELLTAAALDALNALPIEGCRLVPVHALEGQRRQSHGGDWLAEAR